MDDQYLLVKDKWDTYAVSNPKGVEYAAIDLLVKRVDDGFWYHGDTLDKANRILNHFYADSDKDVWAAAALTFLLDRADAEYEYVEVKSDVAH